MRFLITKQPCLQTRLTLALGALIAAGMVDDLAQMALWPRVAMLFGV